MTLTDTGPTAVTLPLATAVHQDQSIQVAANTLPAPSTVQYVAPTGYALAGAAVTISLDSQPDAWGTNCAITTGCLTNSDLNTVVAADGSSLTIDVPSVDVLETQIGSSSASTTATTLYLDVDADDPTPTLQHITFEFKTTFAAATAGGGGGSGGGGAGTTSGVVAAGGSLSSDPPGTVPTASNPLVVTVTSPSSGTITIVKGGESPAIGGYTVLGADSQITAPIATAAQPLRLSFSIDAASLPTGTYVGDITVFRDGVAVPGCPGSVVASFDPCVAATSLTNGVFTESVLSSHASSWDLEAAQVGRLTGQDRFATAVAVSQSAFPAGNADAVVLARGDDYPDALVGGPLCAARNASLLLTSGPTLPRSTEAEIERVLPRGRTVYLLGGTNAIPAAIADQLTTLGYLVMRYGGSDRYATARQVADALGDPSTVLLATGTNFPDALSAGVAAAEENAAVLLTDGKILPPATSSYLSSSVSVVYAVGGPAATADPSATPIVGNDRYETAIDVARRFFPAPLSLGVASGNNFPDALSGTALLGRAKAPLILTPLADLPTAVASYVASVQNTVATAQIFGGSAAIADNVRAAIGTQLGK